MVKMDIKLQLADLEKKLKKKIEDVMENEVAKVVIDEGKKQVQKEVYDKYEPKKYQRTGRLKEEWSKESIDNGIRVINTREDDKTGKYIPKVIETGEGYDYGGYGYAYEKPRPFIQKTRESLEDSGNHIKALRKGLKRQGVKVK